jgi:hypothetical protein
MGFAKQNMEITSPRHSAKNKPAQYTDNSRNLWFINIENSPKKNKH